MENLVLYHNILRSGITKVSTRPDIFPCAEVIEWILPKVDAAGMVMNNVEDKGFASFTPRFIAKAYNLPPSEISMTTEWVKKLKFDYIATTKIMVAEGNIFKNKQSEEYETPHLCTPYRLVVLMLNRIFDRADGRTYKFGWIPLIYKGTILNWADIVANSLSTSITAAQEGLHQRKFEFYMGSFFIDCILSFHPFEKLCCTWKGGKTPIYAAFQIPWGHKYHNFYRLTVKSS